MGSFTDGSGHSGGGGGGGGGGGSTWRTGHGAPSNGVGADNDLYLDVDAGNVYQRASGTYSIVANITGPTGAAGSNGTNGTNGSNGSAGATGPAGPAPSGTGILRVTSGSLGTPAELSGDVTTAGALATTLAKALRNPLGEMLEIVASSAAGSAYGNTNADIASPATSAPIGIAFVPLVKGNSDYVVLEFISSYAGNIELVMMFAMSAANSGVVALRCDVINVRPVALGAGSGGDPTTNWTPGTPATITPGNDALAHVCASADFAGFGITSVQRGDFITAIVQRPTTSDTHTGDLRILKFGVRAV